MSDEAIRGLGSSTLFIYHPLPNSNLYYKVIQIFSYILKIFLQDQFADFMKYFVLSIFHLRDMVVVVNKRNLGKS